MSATREERLIFAPGETRSTSTSTAAQTTASDPSQQPPPQASPAQAAQFKIGTLHRPSLHPSPITQFHHWFTHPALQPASIVPETCTLSTCHLPSGRVSSRMVYLKELTPSAFVIYSNWGTSQKARDLATNRHVALCFWWKGLERQVRVEGVGERLSREESQLYFRTRVRGSKVGAWGSRQSEVLMPRPGPSPGAKTTDGGGDEEKEGGEGEEEDDGRARLEDQVRQVEERFAGQDDIPVPEFWGGLRVIPDMVEFWQGRESRLHDRFRYSKVAAGEGEGGGEWKIERLNP